MKNKFNKIKYLVLFLLLMPIGVGAAMTPANYWNSNQVGDFLNFLSPQGYSLQLNGSNHYLNFGPLTGLSGYGFRDNSGNMEVKNSGGSWTAIGTGSGGASSTWGTIIGTLSNQTDLQSALDSKLGTTTASILYYPLTNPSGYITSTALNPYLTTSTAASTYQPIGTYITSNTGDWAGTWQLKNPGDFLASSTPYVPTSRTINGQALSSNVSLALSDLSDTAIASSTVGQILSWNGASWVNQNNSPTVNGGSGVDYFYTEATSSISTYFNLSRVPSGNQVDETAVVNNNKVLISSYASNALGGTQIDAGVWTFDFYGYVSITTGNTNLVADVYKRTIGGTETLLFSVTTSDINNTSAGYIEEDPSVQQAFSINSTDVLVVKISAQTTHLTNVTTHFIHGGSSFYSHFNIPLVIRHNDLSGLQGGAANEYYHLTSAEYTGTGTGVFARKDSPIFSTAINGSYLTASQILGTDASKNIVSLPVATYPSLTELSYVKGVTSAIQTQLGTKAGKTWGTSGMTGTINNFAAFDSSGNASYIPQTNYSLTGSGFYIGTTLVANNRASAALVLTGITSIDGTATNLSGTPTLPNGTLATTQSAGDNSTKLATTAYADSLAAATLTLTNKRINPRVVSAASYTTDTGTSLSVATADSFIITAQAGALKFNNPGGTPVEGQKLMVRIKDNGTARALTFDTQFRASSDLALPTTTIISKTMYLGFIWNNTDSKWDFVSMLNNF